MKLPLSVKIIIVILFALAVGLVLLQANNLQPSKIPNATFWPVTAIDTMKYSRDRAQDQDTQNNISQYVSEIASLHPKFIAIDTPYDEEFYPVLSQWVDAARRNHLKVWFRGNFSGWEGWFGYSKMTDISEHFTLTQKFITHHPEIFEDGDIFSSVPEAENGGLGDPRLSYNTAVLFNAFLQNSYSTCTSAFRLINKKIDCGYFAVNGDIAKQILTPETVANTGNRVVIDHYVDSPEKMASDLDYLHAKFPQAKIVLGEFGAPIPDINGDMTDEQQATFTKSLFDVFVKRQSFVEGMNYWTFLGSSTALFNEENMPKAVASTLAHFYQPPMVTGRVVDEYGSGISNVDVLDSDLKITSTDSKGYFAFIGLPGTKIHAIFGKKEYQTISKDITISNSSINLQDVKISTTNTNWVYKIKSILHLL